MPEQKQNILVFDLETTDVDICKAQPVQFCGLLYRDSALIEEQEFFIKIDGEMPIGAYNVHGISKDTLNAHGETRPQAAGHFAGFKNYQPLILMGYNCIAYDVPIWLNFVKKHAVSKYPFPMIYQIIDVMALIVAMNPNSKWPKLGEACQKYNISYDPGRLHNALYDCEKTFEVYLKLQEVMI